MSEPTPLCGFKWNVPQQRAPHSQEKFRYEEHVCILEQGHEGDHHSFTIRYGKEPEVVDGQESE
jgi:hypothetical protein